MNWHTGNIAEAVAESKAKDAIFVVYIEGQDEMTEKLDRFLSDARVSSKLQTSDFVGVKVQGESAAYTQFSALYKVVPVPSIFFIGKTGTPLDIATGIIASVEELVSKIDKVLILAGKQTDPDASTSGTAARVLSVSDETVRTIAGADEDADSDASAEPEPTATSAEQDAVNTEQSTVNAEQSTVNAKQSTVNAKQSTVNAEQAPEQESVPVEEVAVEPTVAAAVAKPPATTTTAAAPEPTAAALSAAAAAEKRAAAASAAQATAAATTSAMIPNAMASLMPVSVPLVPQSVDVASQGSTGSHTEGGMMHIQNLIEQKKREKQEEEKRREKENELRRRREGREAQTKEVLTREQELKNMQERIRRDRQQEQETRDRILAQIAADRAEHANRATMQAEVQSINTVTTTTTTAISPGQSISSVYETRLQIRLPGGLTRTKAFAAEEPLTTVRMYVLNELLAGSDIREFTLATSYPRREFKLEDEVKTLTDLNLVPNAVLLVLKREHVNSVVRTSGNLMNILTSMIWAILTPATVAFDYLNRMGLQRLRLRFSQMVSNVGWGKSAGRAPGNGDAVQVPNDASSRRNLDMFVMRSTPAPGLPQTSSMPNQSATGQQANAQHSQSADAPQSTTNTTTTSAAAQQQRTGSVRQKRYGESNIRRLADTKKDEDDKATYNGNSTQQQ